MFLSALKALLNLNHINWKGEIVAYCPKCKRKSVYPSSINVENRRIRCHWCEEILKNKGRVWEL